MKIDFEVWAQLFLADDDAERVRNFFIRDVGVKQKYVLKRLHMTLYHARRQLRGLHTGVEAVSVVVPASDTRFMVMAPGGENPRPNIDPATRKVGVRVQWQSTAMPQIQALRQRFIALESPRVLGNRARSTARTSAFGARSFQAHMALLRAGSGVPNDLTQIGAPFRENLGNLRFDRFLVEAICLTSGDTQAFAKVDEQHESDA